MFEDLVGHRFLSCSLDLSVYQIYVLTLIGVNKRITPPFSRKDDIVWSHTPLFVEKKVLYVTDLSFNKTRSGSKGISLRHESIVYGKRKRKRVTQ